MTANIVLIGFMGTGKSAVGRALARYLGWRHLDTDTEIEREAGKSIPQIFGDEGEAAFRSRETALLSSLTFVNKGRETNLILSTGGGTPLRPENAALLRQIGTVVWLQAPPETIMARVGRALADRPLLAGYESDPQGRIESLLAERASRYASVADCSLDTTGCSGPNDAAEQVLRLLSLESE